MSVSKWAYEPTVCIGEICVGECDNCPLCDEALAERERESDETLQESDWL